MASPRATVVVPLYIWPTSSASWEPLYESISTHPTVDFLVVVNPDSGPGGEPLPGHDYERELPKLNAAANVCTIGYVRIDYCRKPLHETCEEIDRFAGWAKDRGDKPNLAMHGIYVDETPNHYSAGRALYLEALHKHIKSREGLLGQRLVRLIFHNPGTPPDSELASPAIVDVIITCEEPYQRYSGEQVQTRLREYFVDRTRSGYQISDVSRNVIRKVVGELRHKGAYIFATSLVEDFYESFGECWREFVSAMDTIENW
ncbi:cell surface protein [Dothidotthia symphoricarpi CBS 119687]|uniref:Cell surface protein n=1 Tax=Dothidotthia symphoricarpi CBS 119687 TaxID=1392245 RepID=A0A6A6A5A9_9PLEO|nr:cell surface protein [Dothidotthia symphoricarpi CBS 119687]KAF2126990.1 cell surface protein [Dothidotthia symphoricarpi CBS 119687]